MRHTLFLLFNFSWKFVGVSESLITNIISKIEISILDSKWRLKTYIRVVFLLATFYTTYNLNLNVSPATHFSKTCAFNEHYQHQYLLKIQFMKNLNYFWAYLEIFPFPSYVWTEKDILVRSVISGIPINFYNRKRNQSGKETEEETQFSHFLEQKNYSYNRAIQKYISSEGKYISTTCWHLQSN